MATNSTLNHRIKFVKPQIRAKVRLPQICFISKVELMIGRIVVTLKSGKQKSYSYERLTEAQETKLRSMAQPLPQRREAKPNKSQSASKPRRTHNYAEEVTRRTTTEAIFVKGFNAPQIVVEV